MHSRPYSRVDNLISGLDRALQTVFGSAANARENPAHDVVVQALTPAQAGLSGCLMRINHSGEVCAQALYQGQALTATSVRVRETMKRAAEEENDHLAWTAQRMEELCGTPVRSPLAH